MRNRFEVRGNVTAITLRRRDGTTMETLIDTDDLPKAQKAGSWKAAKSPKSESFYCDGKIGGRIVQLHRFLLDAPDEYQVDHINHDTLDNRRANIRCVSRTVNMLNRKGPNNNNRSGFRGVYWVPRKQKWHARIRVSGKLMHLGSFDDPSQASEVVNAKCAEIMTELLKDRSHAAD